MKKIILLFLFTCFCIYLSAQDIIHIENKSLGNIDLPATEASGLVWLTDTLDVWTHNDYWGAYNGPGNEAPANLKDKIFELNIPSSMGPGDTIFLSNTITINDPNINSNKLDWEDITKDENNNVYVGDFGDNNNGINRILKIPNPNNLGSSVNPDIIYFEYPTINSGQVVNNTEAMFYFNGYLYLFSKVIRGDADGYEKEDYTYMFKIPATPNTIGTKHIATDLGGFKTNINNDVNENLWKVTGADISPDKQTVILLCQGRLWIFNCFQGDDFFGGQSRYVDFYKNGSPSYSQKEGICFTTNTGIYVSEDGSRRLFNLNIAPFINPCPTLTCDLLENSDFNNGDEDWLVYDHNSVNAFWSTSTGAAEFTIADGGDAKWKLQLYQQNIDLVQGKTYAVHFRAKADAPKDIYCKIGNSVDNVSYSFQNLTIGTTWANYTHYFTMNNASDPTSRINFGIGQNNINISLDDIYVRELDCEADCSELIANGKFDNNITDFQLYVHPDADAFWYHNANGDYASIKINNGSTGRWQVQLQQENISLVQGQTYTLKFRAKADATKSIYFKLSNDADNVSYHPLQYINIGSSWAEYTYTFTMNDPSDLTAQLNFGIGQNEIAIRFDDVSLIDDDCNCQNELVHYGPIPEGTYRVNDYIRSHADINSPETVNYKAENIISLDQGFNSNTGAKLNVTIEDCSGSGTTP